MYFADVANDVTVITHLPLTVACFTASSLLNYLLTGSPVACSNPHSCYSYSGAQYTHVQ